MHGQKRRYGLQSTQSGRRRVRERGKKVRLGPVRLARKSWSGPRLPDYSLVKRRRRRRRPLVSTSRRLHYTRSSSHPYVVRGRGSSHMRAPCAREGRRATSHAGSPRSRLLYYSTGRRRGAQRQARAPGTGTGHVRLEHDRGVGVAVARGAAGTRRAQARRAVRRRERSLGFAGAGAGREKESMESERLEASAPHSWVAIAAP
jgi:hypothetical protein